MAPQPDDSADRTGAVFALIGGVLVALGALLPWAKMAIALPGAGREDHSIAGMDSSSGTIALALGIIIVAVSLVALFWRRGGGLGIGAVVAQLACGGFAVVLGILYFTDIDTSAVNAVVEKAGLDPATLGEAGMRILSAASDATAGWGLYLVVLGGVVAFAGGILGAFGLRAALGAGQDDPATDDDLDAVGVDDTSSVTGTEGEEAPGT